MATATKQARTARPRDPRPGDGAPSEFLVFESNSGEYRWEVISGTGASLAHSDSFASYAEAEAAAVRVREGAGNTRLELRKAGDDARPVFVAPGPRDKKER
jgi:hypothetical protein